jgi:hypothetical protein
MMMTDQMNDNDTAQYGGGPPDITIIDVEAADGPDASEDSDVQQEAAEDTALDGGSPPAWLLAAVDHQEHEAEIGSTGPGEPEERAVTQVLPAGTAPVWIEQEDDDEGADVAGAEPAEQN